MNQSSFNSPYNNIDNIDNDGLSNDLTVHIRLTQRNRRKCITTVQGLADDLDLKKICKFLRKEFKCNGTVIKDDEYGEILQFQGDHRNNIKDFLSFTKIINKDKIILHGS